jgi:hypothetical protein
MTMLSARLVVVRAGHGDLRGDHRRRHAQRLRSAGQSRTAATAQAQRTSSCMPSGGDALHCACRRASSRIVEPRLQRADALQQRRMGGEQLACEELVEAHAIAEQHVADFLGIAALVESRSIVQATDLLQRAGQPCVCRVNCTALASASFSRVRLTPALIMRPKNSPT